MTSKTTARIAEYLAHAQANPQDFRNRDGGVRIALEADEIADIESRVAAQYVGKGWRPEWSEVGLCYRDPFICLIRDAVVFPGGRVAIHHRVLFGAEPSGVAALPVMDGRIVLIRHFRHPSRGWHWEIPRGAAEAGEDPEQSVHIELAEEIGANVVELLPLGPLMSSSSLIGSSVSLFLARIETTGQPALDEGITSIETFSVLDVERMLAAGDITDSYTNAAFLRARLRGLL